VQKERLALDHLHDNERMTVLFADVVHRDDIEVIQRRRELRFTCKALSGIVVDVIRDELDGDDTAETCIARVIDLAHSARAESADDLIRAEPSSCGKGHVQLCC
jgi:hypothetical protein